MLNTCDDALIQQAKKQYWQQYKSSWRVQQRKENVEITVILNSTEAKLIFDNAKKYKRSKSAFIKTTCISYLQNRYVVPDILAVNTIKELLTMNYAAIKNLSDDNAIPYQTGTFLLNQLSGLETKIVDQLVSPTSLEKYITETIQQNHEYKMIIYSLLQNTGCDNQKYYKESG